MGIRIKREVKTSAILNSVQELSGVNLSLCYYCKKCTSGCPVAVYTGITPSEIVRRLQLGVGDELFDSEIIWLCASCEACTTRCPMDIDIAGVMDTLRMMAVERKVAIPDARGATFNRSFLGSVRRYGRVFELGMLAVYKLCSGELFSDVGKFPQMLAKGKISLLPKRSGEAKRIRQVFRRAEEEDRRRG